MAIIVAAIENHKNKEIDSLCAEYLKKLNGPFATKLDLLFLCDERGKMHHSLSFANFLQQELSTLRGKIIIAIGGAYGFTQEALQAYPTLRLSDLTFPHHLARLVLIEQIYRAYNIQKGTGYHHI